MMTTSERLQQWMTHPALLNAGSLDELRLLVQRYPYFQSARLLYLKNLSVLDDASFGEELRKAAPFVADRSVLYHLIEGYVADRLEEAQSVAPASADRTSDLIDAFLTRQPEKTEPAARKIPMDYVLDYTPYLMQEEADADWVEEESTAVPPLRGQDLIDGFIREQQGQRPRAARMPLPDEPAPEAKGPDLEAENVIDESYFTETLAKIYIKQRRYEKALEIIKKLSLNYPKKNAYFADQIRFLEKLIINNNSK